MSDERARVIDALTRWRARRAWARCDPRALAIRSIEEIGPTQIVLRSIYEARGVRYHLQPAPSRPSIQDAGPDPWSVRLEHPDGAPIGHEIETRISGTTVLMDCGMCSGIGEMTCPTCGGSGSVSDDSNRGSVPCMRCGSSGQVRCDQCRGSGGMLGSPRVWSRLEETERVHVHEDERLPLEVYLALQEPGRGGDVIFTQEDEHITELRRPGGYRDPAPRDAALADTVRRVCSDAGVPHGGRVRKQRLEIRRVSAWSIELESGERAVVYGDPPEVAPARALASPAWHAARLAPYVLGALAGLGALAWVAR